MRPRSKGHLNRRYFHTQPKRDKRDIVLIKTKIESITQKKLKRLLEEKEKKRWH